MQIKIALMQHVMTSGAPQHKYNFINYDYENTDRHERLSANCILVYTPSHNKLQLLEAFPSLSSIEVSASLCSQ